MSKTYETYLIMNEQDKQLLLKVLCAMLPYGVIVNYKEGEYDFHKWKIETLHAPAYSESGLLIETNSDGWIGYTEYEGCGLSSASRALHLDKNLPYLRPLSSMTEEEYDTFPIPYTFDSFSTWNNTILSEVSEGTQILIGIDEITEIIDWLNAHHFDYFGLIEKGLALEAPEGMYNN